MNSFDFLSNYFNLWAPPSLDAFIVDFSIVLGQQTSLQLSFHAVSNY